MNKPAAKEPSMDEILSSIRQIIADDDAPVPPVPRQVAPEPETAFADLLNEEEDDDAEPLELSSDQIVEEEDPSAGGADIDAMLGRIATDEDEDEGTPELVDPADLAFEADGMQAEPEPQPSPRVSVAASAPMPDASLSSDIADRLLAPATDSAVRGTFAKLGDIAIGNHSVTIENMIREMLRPMLKEWLDENLPGLVEQLVEKEIARIARGGR